MARLRIGETIFIDGDGEVWGSFERMCTHLGVEPNAAVEVFMLQSMGGVRISADTSALRIVFNPGHVSGSALAALLFTLADNPDYRCLAVLHDHQRHATTMVLPQSDKCAAILSQIVRKSQAQSVEVLHRQTLEPVQYAEIAPLLKAVSYWRDTDGRYSFDSFQRLLEVDLGGRFVLFVKDAETGAVLFKKVGSGLPPFAVKTMSNLIGLRSEQHPDPDYGKACAIAYQHAIARWEPMLEVVEAKAFWPEHGRLRRRYSRLILPFKAEDDTVEVLSATMQSRTDRPYSKVG